MVAEGREQALDKLHIRLILIEKRSEGIFVLQVLRFINFATIR